MQEVSCSDWLTIVTVTMIVTMTGVVVSQRGEKDELAWAWTDARHCEEQSVYVHLHVSLFRMHGKSGAAEVV